MSPLWSVAFAGGAAVAAGVWLRRRYVLVTVDGLSMMPALRPGHRLLVRRAAVRRVRRGGLVVVRDPAGLGFVVKRAVAVPGDPAPLPATPRVVPAGHLYLLGDNAALSHDSRIWGYVDDERLLGVVHLVIRPARGGVRTAPQTTFHGEGDDHNGRKRRREDAAIGRTHRRRSTEDGRAADQGDRVGG